MACNIFSWKIFVGNFLSNFLLDMFKTVKEDSSEKYSGSLPAIQFFLRGWYFENTYFFCKADIKHQNKLRICIFSIKKNMYILFSIFDKKILRYIFLKILWS